MKSSASNISSRLLSASTIRSNVQPPRNKIEKHREGSNCSTTPPLVVVPVVPVVVVDVVGLRGMQEADETEDGAAPVANAEELNAPPVVALLEPLDVVDRKESCRFFLSYKT